MKKLIASLMIGLIASTATMSAMASHDRKHHRENSRYQHDRISNKYTHQNRSNHNRYDRYDRYEHRDRYDRRDRHRAFDHHQDREHFRPRMNDRYYR